MHQCTKRCGSGKQTRSKKVKAKFGGNNCMGSSQQDCNTQNLYENLKQREGESYRELVQRIQDTLKGCQVEGLLSKKALEGHILFKASFNENDI